MNPDRAASIFRELLMTPVTELDQIPRRAGLDVLPSIEDLAHARELLRAILVGLQSASGPNWDPVHTAWGAMAARHGTVLESAMGPAPPGWVRNLPPKPGLGDPPPGSPGYAQPAAYAAPPAAPIPMGQPPMPMGQPMPMQPQMGQPPMPMGQPMPMQPQMGQPMPMQPQMGQPQMPHAMMDPPPPMQNPGPRKVARTEPGVPLPPPPPGREAWPQPPQQLHGGNVPTPTGHVQQRSGMNYAAPEGYPAQQGYAPMPGGGAYPGAPTPGPSGAYAAPGYGSQPGYPPAPQQPAYPSPPTHGVYADAGPRPMQGSGYPPNPYPGNPNPGNPNPGSAYAGNAYPANPSQAPAEPIRDRSNDTNASVETSVHKYAAFCAACATSPERVFQIMVEYGVNSPQAREELDESWQDRFDEDSTLHGMWEQLFGQYRAKMGG